MHYNTDLASRLNARIWRDLWAYNPEDLQSTDREWVSCKALGSSTGLCVSTGRKLRPESKSQHISAFSSTRFHSFSMPEICCETLRMNYDLTFSSSINISYLWFLINILYYILYYNSLLFLSFCSSLLSLLLFFLFVYYLSFPFMSCLFLDSLKAY